MDLRVLFVEDSPDDLELMVRRLREAGIQLEWQRVDTEDALRLALRAPWDLALVDYNLPGFGGIKALRVLAQAAPDVPAITVSGAISEDTAVATITAGAVDYVLKDNLTRLAPAAQRAVEGAELRCREREAAAMAAESDALYRRIVETAREGIWAMDAEYRTTFVNSQMAQMLGYEVEEMLGRPVTDFMFEEDLAIDGAAMRRISHEVSGSFQAHLRSKDGVEIWASVSSSADLGPGGEFLGSFAMFTDITEHKQAEEEFRRMALAVDTAPDSITVHDLDGRFLYANQRTLELHGYSRDEFLALSLRQLDAPAAEELIAARMQELRERGEASFEAAHFRKDGTTLPVEVRAKLTTWGGKSAILSVATDITERRQAEESLHQSHELLRAVLDSLPTRVFWKDRDLVYLGCNTRFALDAGFEKPEDIIGKDDYAMGWREQAELYRAADRDVIESGESRLLYEEPQTTPSGGLIQLLTSKVLLRDAGGAVVGVLGAYLDVTEQYEAQQQVLRQAAQLKRTVEGAVLAMSHMVESRDPYTAGHERRVSELATALGAHLGMAGEELTALRLAGLIHDIGKIAVPAEILAKPGRLSEVEFNLIRQHPQSGFEILGAIDFGGPVAEMVLQHHERLDGSGYPRALAGQDVLPEARILAVADVVEAMSSHRPHRAALGMDAALAEVREHAGEKYDPEVVAACVRLFEEQGFAFTE